MTSDRKAKIESAIENIRSFHKLGTQLPKKSSPKANYREGVIEEKANKHGMNPDTVCKVRLLAEQATRPFETSHAITRATTARHEPSGHVHCETKMAIVRIGE